jgi:predicted DNA-binding transcriptional regulator AlpA
MSANGCASCDYCDDCFDFPKLWRATAASGKDHSMPDQALATHNPPNDHERHAPAEPATMLLSKTDLARELRVSAKTIDRMDQSGRLPRPIRVGSRAKRWPRSAIVEWIAAGAPNRRDWERMCR